MVKGLMGKRLLLTSRKRFFQQNQRLRASNGDNGHSYGQEQAESNTIQRKVLRKSCIDKGLNRVKYLNQKKEEARALIEFNLTPKGASNYLYLCLPTIIFIFSYIFRRFSQDCQALYRTA